MAPVYIFEEHAEAFYFWHKMKFEGFISQPLDLFHVDAHDDMAVSERFRRSLYFSGGPGNGYLGYYKKFTQKELDIGNFIIPAVLNRLVRNVYFIFPRWRNFSHQRRRMNVGSAFGEGFALRCGIGKGRKTPLQVLKAFPDLTFFNYSRLGIDRLPKSRRVILDIDFDYFACVDSIHNHFSYEMEITRDQFLRRGLLRKEETLPFSRLEFHFLKRRKKYYARISPKKGKEVSYRPSKEEIKSEITTLLNALNVARTKVVAVTISKSSRSGYCPREYRSFIERELLKGLGGVLNR